MGGCVIELREEWDAPWEVAAAVYVFKMENTADGTVEREDVRSSSHLSSALSDSSGSESQPDDAPDGPGGGGAGRGHESDGDDDGGSGGVDDFDEHLRAGRNGGRRSGSAERTQEEDEAAVIEPGDYVRLSRAGLASHQRAMSCMRRQRGHSGLSLPKCLAPGTVGLVLEAGTLPTSSGKRYRVRALGGGGGIFWYSRQALALDAPPPLELSEPQMGGRELAVPDAQLAVSREDASWTPRPASSRAMSITEWDYAIDFAIPWLLRKVFSLKVLQLVTTVRMETAARRLHTSMTNVSQVMNIKLVEVTEFTANGQNGTTWHRKLTVSYPDWLPGWAERKVKALYNEETAKASAAFREVFADMRSRAALMARARGIKSKLGYAPPTSGFLAQLGLDDSLRDLGAIEQSARQVV
jgi:hypothetical protein